MKLIATLWSSVSGILKVAVFGILSTCLLWGLGGSNIWMSGAITFGAIGAVVLVHAPEDGPGGVDFEADKDSYPSILAGFCMIVSAITFLVGVCLK